MNVYDELKERGFIAQATHENEIRDLFEKDENGEWVLKNQIK